MSPYLFSLKFNELSKKTDYYISPKTLTTCERTVTVQNVLYFIVDNIDEGKVNIEHTVDNEVDQVLLVPLQDLTGEQAKVPDKYNPGNYI